MKRFFSLFILILTIGLMLIGHGIAKPLNIVTAVWAPYNMVEDGKITGLGTEIVQAILKQAGMKSDIKVYPWARTYRMALNEPNTMVYLIIRLPERENLFKWVGPIVPVRSVIHKLKNRRDIQLRSLDDAKKYKIGTTRNAAGHQYLVKRGFQENVNIFLENSNAKSVQILYKGFVDLESSVEMNFKYEASRQGYSNRDVEEAWLLFENQGYIAFSTSTPDHIIEKVQTALDILKDQGVVDNVIQKYKDRYDMPLN